MSHLSIWSCKAVGNLSPSALPTPHFIHAIYAMKHTRVCFNLLLLLCGRSGGGGGGGGFDGFGQTPFLPQIHPESPGNGVSNVPDFKFFHGSMPPNPPSSQIWSPLDTILDLPPATKVPISISSPTQFAFCSVVSSVLCEWITCKACMFVHQYIDCT